MGDEQRRAVGELELDAVGVGRLAALDLEQAMRNVETVLKTAGSGLDKLVKVTILIARPQDFAGMNEAYAEFFPGNKPARAVARLGPEIPGVLISIEAVALA